MKHKLIQLISAIIIATLALQPFDFAQDRGLAGGHFQTQGGGHLAIQNCKRHKEVLRPRAAANREWWKRLNGIKKFRRNVGTIVRYLAFFNKESCFLSNSHTRAVYPLKYGSFLKTGALIPEGSGMIMIHAHPLLRVESTYITTAMIPSPEDMRYLSAVKLTVVIWGEINTGLYAVAVPNEKNNRALIYGLFKKPSISEEEALRKLYEAGAEIFSVEKASSMEYVLVPVSLDEVCGFIRDWDSPTNQEALEERFAEQEDLIEHTAFQRGKKESGNKELRLRISRLKAQLRRIRARLRRIEAKYGDLKKVPTRVFYRILEMVEDTRFLNAAQRGAERALAEKKGGTPKPDSDLSLLLSSVLRPLAAREKPEARGMRGGPGIGIGVAGMLLHKGPGNADECVMRTLRRHIYHLKTVAMNNWATYREVRRFARFADWFDGRMEAGGTLEEVPDSAKLPVYRLAKREDDKKVQEISADKRLEVVRLPEEELGRINNEPLYVHLGLEDAVIWLAERGDKTDVELRMIQAAVVYAIALDEARSRGWDKNEKGEMYTMARWRDSGKPKAVKFFRKAYVMAWKLVVEAYKDRWRGLSIRVMDARRDKSVITEYRKTVREARAKIKRAKELLAEAQAAESAATPALDSATAAESEARSVLEAI